MAGFARPLRILARVLFGLVLLAVLAVAGVAYWLYFYTGDLPDTSAMAVFVTNTPTTISTAICGDAIQIVVVPGSEMQKLRQAILAAEGEFDPMGTFRRFVSGGYSDRGPRYGIYSIQLARQMQCLDRGKNMPRAFREMRTAIQLERRFGEDQLLDVYLNRLYFGPKIYGAESAAKFYFGKPPNDLSTSEAALLAGLTRSPNQYSLERHPDRAIARRNEIIDGMVRRGSITSQEAEAAKREPLKTVSH